MITFSARIVSLRQWGAFAAASLGETCAPTRLVLAALTAGSPSVAAALSLQVDTRTGQVQFRNPTAASIAINGYELTSAAGSLNPAGWNSFSDQNLDPVDGPDAGSTPGDGVGETWDEAGGASRFGLQEGFLFGSTVLPVGGTLSLGAAFDTAIAVEDLAFSFRRADGAIADGGVEYVESSIPGDFDGDVDGADLVVWTANFGSTTADPLSGDADGDSDADGNDFLVWQRNLTGPQASASAAAVPELGACGLAMWAGFAPGDAIRAGDAANLVILSEAKNLELPRSVAARF